MTKKIIIGLIIMFSLTFVACNGLDYDNGNTFYTITTGTIEGEGIIELEPNKNLYETGEILTITAIANDGYEFEEWSGNLSGNENPQTITVTSNMTIGAKFVEDDSEEILWVHIDTIYRVNAAGNSNDHVSHDHVDYYEEAYDQGGFVHLKNNSYEQNMTVDRYEDALYGRGPYSHTEDRHVIFTWDDPPSVVSPGDTFNIKVDVEVLSDSYMEEWPANRWPTVQVLRTKPADIGYTYAFHGYPTQMIEPIEVERNTVRLTRLEINPFGTLLDWNYPPAYYLDSCGYTVYKCHTEERSVNHEGDLEYFEVRFRHAKVHYLYELQVQ